MKRIVAISLALVLVVLFAVMTIHGRSKNVDGKIEWKEDKPAICLYSESGPPEVAYKVYVSGRATNVSKDKLEVLSVIFNLYDSAGENLGEQTFDTGPFSSSDTMSMSFFQYYGEQVTHYDVFFTDSQGKEYACALAISVAEGKMAENLEGKIKWIELDPFACVYHEVSISGQTTNVSQENVNIASLIIRFYNQAGEQLSFYDMLAGETRDAFDTSNHWWLPVLLIPGEEGWGAIFNQGFAEEVVRYDVFATDSQGREYACVRTTSGGGGANGERLAIEDTIRGYLETYNARDYAQCLTYFTGYGDLNDALGALAFFRDLSGELGFQEIREVAITNQTATVTVVFTIGGEEGIDQMQLKEVDGQWKIVW